MRSLVEAAFEVRAPTWPEPIDLRPRCAECDELLLMRRTGRRRKICRKPECKRASFNRWHAEKGGPLPRAVRGLGRAIGRELAGLIGGAA